MINVDQLSFLILQLPKPMRDTSNQKRVSILSSAEKETVSKLLLDPIEYRKSGLSLNHIVGCPLDCGYCVRHLFGNFQQKIPRALMSDEDAVQALVTHPYFQADITPIQLFNRATDPMLPNVKWHTLRILALLDDLGLKNNVLVITRWKIKKEDCAAFNALKNIRLSIFVTYSGIENPKIEPVNSEIAVHSLRTLYENSVKYRAILYWRPIVPGMNDTEAHLSRARELSRSAHATVFSGLFFRREIAAYYEENGLPLPYSKTARRKILPEQTETRILAAFRDYTGGSPLFRKTSCAVAYAHGIADYNGHFGIRELCDICPTNQFALCEREWKPPTVETTLELVNQLGAKAAPTITERAIVVSGLDEPRRYFMQHRFGFQVHDSAKPHHFGRHGRSDIGWVRDDDMESK